MDTELPILPASLDTVVKDHLDTIHKAIAERAQELALQDASGAPGTSPRITPLHCLKAINQIAPGRRVGAVLIEASTPFWHRFASTVSPVTLISSVLTIVFAAFGLWALSAKAPAAGGNMAINGGAYLDIAKIFAGAIVGSASVAAVTTTTRSVPAGLDKKSKGRQKAIASLKP